MSFRPWRAIKRRLDTRILWPICVAEAGPGRLGLARQAFFTHMQLDQKTYGDLSEAEKIAYVESLV